MSLSQFTDNIIYYFTSKILLQRPTWKQNITALLSLVNRNFKHNHILLLIFFLSAKYFVLTKKLDLLSNYY